MTIHNTIFLLINQKKKKKKKWLQTLHSTMFLLIRLLTAWQRQLQFQSLHSTMFLLIHILIEEVSLIGFAFTFHNVSINTVSIMSTQHNNILIKKPQIFFKNK